MADDDVTAEEAAGGEPFRPVQKPKRPTKLPWLAVIALFLVMAVAGPVLFATYDENGGGGGGYSNGGGATVKMASLKFVPNTLVVKRGTEVQFVNEDVAPHTVTAEDNSIDSGTLRPGAGAFRLTISQRFQYYCAIHPSMKATIEISG